MTNLEVAFSPKDIVRAYQKRGTMENYIKEAKNGFRLDHMNSHLFPSKRGQDDVESSRL